jgi:hypothetical protein
MEINNSVHLIKRTKEINFPGQANAKACDSNPAAGLVNYRINGTSIKMSIEFYGNSISEASTEYIVYYWVYDDPEEIETIITDTQGHGHIECENLIDEAHLFRIALSPVQKYDDRLEKLANNLSNQLSCLADKIT